MAKELVEGSVYAQVEAIEAWALKARNEANTRERLPNLDEILKNLKNINLQGRKLQWRGTGLKSLPKIELTERLNKKLSEIRVAAMKAHGDIRAEQKKAKAKGITPEISRQALINLRVLVAGTLNARKLVETYAQINLAEIIKDKSKTEDFFHGSGDYKAYSLDVRRKLWNDFFKKWKPELSREFNGLNLSGIDLSGFDFGLRIIRKCNFSGSNVEGTSFRMCHFFDDSFLKMKAKKADFKEGIGFISISGDFSETNFSLTPSLSSIEFIVKGDVNFSGADFKNVSLTLKLEREVKVNFNGADLKNASLTLKSEREVEVNFNGADLKNAKINLASNRKTSFANADLREAEIILIEPPPGNFDFTGADVARATLNFKLIPLGKEFQSIYAEAIKKAKNWDRAIILGLEKAFAE